jgi:hypothetical protein
MGMGQIASEWGRVTVPQTSETTATDLAPALAEI